jgi:hypothetical protein
MCFNLNMSNEIKVLCPNFIIANIDERQFVFGEVLLYALVELL